MKINSQQKISVIQYYNYNTTSTIISTIPITVITSTTNSSMILHISCFLYKEVSINESVDMTS